MYCKEICQYRLCVLAQYKCFIHCLAHRLIQQNKAIVNCSGVHIHSITFSFNILENMLNDDTFNYMSVYKQGCSG